MSNYSHTTKISIKKDPIGRWVEKLKTTNSFKFQPPKVINK
jgi:hypothetical protein